MRDLTAEEHEVIERRRAGLDLFLQERMPVLAEFAEALQLSDPAQITEDPDACLPSVSAFIRDRTIEDDDQNWILTRVGYLVGDVLVQRLGGAWFLNDVPDTRYFARYVVGRFSRAPRATVEPFEVAIALLSMPLGRDLVELVAEVEREARGE